jgi:multidrug resistance protein MdtO
MSINRSRHINVLRTIRAELAPFSGRLSGSLRDTLGITIALVIAMTLRVPGISLALALLFLLQRERPGLTLRSALHILGGAVIATAAALFWVQLTDGTDVARFLGVVLGIFVAAFCMATTTLPLFFTIFGFYGFVGLSAWDAHRSQDAIVTSTLYNIASLAIVMLTAVGVEYLFGTRHPANDLEHEARKRLTALSRFFHALAQGRSTREPVQLRSLHNTLVQYAHAGDLRMNELYDRIRDAGSTLSSVPLGTHYRIGLLTRVLEKSALIGFNSLRGGDQVNHAHYAAIAAQCDHLLSNTSHAPSAPLPSSASARLIDIHTELQQYAASLASPETTSNRAPQPATRSTDSFRLFLPGAFQSPDAAIYALKLTLAATLCYVLYNAVAWPSILTCVITVLFTGLSSTGAMKQKQLYRFSGAAIGGLLGIATESLLFPNMDSITSLVLVVAAVSLLSAWVLRSPRMGYVGVQIGFAFFLTTLQGFSATTQISPARDRVIGVALGILVMWFVFDQLWPTRTTKALSQILHRIREAAAQLRQATDQTTDQNGDQNDPATFAETLSRLRVTVSLDLATTQLLDSAAYFDFGRGHKRQLARSRRLIRQIESAAGDFYAEALHRNEDQRFFR